jgi:hypothetical protein
MSTASSLNAPAETTARIGSLETASLDQLVQRLSKEVNVAEERVRAIQDEANETFVIQRQRLAHFVAVADRIHEILLPRLEAFKNVSVFQDTIRQRSMFRIETTMKMNRSP